MAAEKTQKMVEHLRARGPGWAFRLREGHVVTFGPGSPCTETPAASFTHADLEAAVAEGALISKRLVFIFNGTPGGLDGYVLKEGR
jgi:hypothetical protein